VPIISNESASFSQIDDSKQVFCMLTGEDVKNLKKEGHRSVSSHNDFIQTCSKGKQISLTVCKFQNKDTERCCSDIVIEFVNNPSISTRQITIRLEDANIEPWERSGVVLSHCTTKEYSCLEVIEKKAFYDTVQRTYKGQGFGSRQSAKSFGTNVYQGMYIMYSYVVHDLLPQSIDIALRFELYIYIFTQVS
jgi:hypothetical protein